MDPRADAIAPPAGLRRLLDRHAMSLVLSLLTLLALVALWSATWRASNAELVAADAAARTALPELIDTYEAQLIRNLDAIEQTLKVTSYAISLKGAAGALPDLDRQRLLPPGLLFVVAITDREGKVVASNPPAPTYSVAQQAYFQRQRWRVSDAMEVSLAVADQAGRDPQLHFTRRLNDPAGRFAGIVMVTVDPAYFTSGYEHAQLGDHGLLGLFGDDDQLRALRSGDAEVGRARLPDLARATAVAPWDGVPRYTAVRQLPASGLQLVVGLAHDEQLAPARAHRRRAFMHAGLASLGLLLLAGLGGLWSWQRSTASRSIRIAQETYAAASEANLDAFFLLRSVRNERGETVDFTIGGCNTRAMLMTGLSKQALIGMSVLELAPSARSNGQLERLIHTAATRGVYEQEWENSDMPQIKARWLHQQLVGVGDAVVAIVRDITDRKLAEAHIVHLARHDALTGLPNRNMIGERLDLAIGAASEPERVVLVAFIDLDGFKLINDSLGHNAGDQLLQQVTARIQHLLLPGDTLGRFGGDEFVLVLPRGTAQLPETNHLLEQVRGAVARPLTLLSHQVEISCSIGLAVYPRDAADGDALLLKADMAMYRAKEAGKNSVQFFVPEMGSQVDAKLLLLEEMRRGIAEQQFVLLYQPKVDLRTGALFGVEALLRWRHPELGLISPLTFIPLAEESGLIVPLGDWVLRTACRQNQAWRTAGLAPISVAVNVSARQFDDQALVAQVAAALADSGLDVDGLELEVTESLLMRDLATAVAKMAQFKQMGIALSIDDFGTGYSSLSSLKTYPISRLKIDQSFVRELATSADDRAIARAIIAMAHQLHLRVIAEGVETEEQCRFLRDSGCDEMQGYLVSRPVEADAIAGMLAAAAAVATDGAMLYAG